MLEDVYLTTTTMEQEASATTRIWLSSLRSAIARVIAWPHNGLIAVLIAVTGVYAPTLHQSFHGDDFVAFTEFKTKSFWAYSKAVFTFKDYNFYWRPLGKISDNLLFQV